MLLCTSKYYPKKRGHFINHGSLACVSLYPKVKIEVQGTYTFTRTLHLGRVMMKGSLLWQLRLVKKHLADYRSLYSSSSKINFFTYTKWSSQEDSLSSLQVCWATERSLHLHQAKTSETHQWSKHRNSLFWVDEWLKKWTISQSQSLWNEREYTGVSIKGWNINGEKFPDLFV